MALFSFLTCFSSCRTLVFCGKLLGSSGGASLAVITVCRSSSPSVASCILRGSFENEGRFQPWHCSDKERVCFDCCEPARARASSLNVLKYFNLAISDLKLRLLLLSLLVAFV